MKEYNNDKKRIKNFPVQKRIKEQNKKGNK